jgi:hypothetical protein
MHGNSVAWPAVSRTPRPDTFMEAAALILALVLAVACVVFVAHPFLREPAPANDRLAEVPPAERERQRLAEERDRALAALKELEFDHRTGKISDADYRELVTPLRRQAAETLRALEPETRPSQLEREDVRA